MLLFVALKRPNLSTTSRMSMIVTSAPKSSYALTFLPPFLEKECHLTSGGTDGYVMMLILGAVAGRIGLARVSVQAPRVRWGTTFA